MSDVDQFFGQEVVPGTNDHVANKLRAFQQLKAEHAAAEDQAKELREKVKHAKRAIVEELEGVGLTSIKFEDDDGVRRMAYLSRMTKGSCRKDNLPRLHAWLRRHGRDPGDVMQLSVGKLSSLVKDCSEGGGEMPDGVDVYQETNLCMRKG